MVFAEVLRVYARIYKRIQVKIKKFSKGLAPSAVYPLRSTRQNIYKEPFLNQKKENKGGYNRRDICGVYMIKKYFLEV